MGRLYFAFQGFAGLLWWLGVFLSEEVRQATLGSLPPLPVALIDVPLFVVGSFLAATGFRPAVWTVLVWSFVVTAAMFVYATVTREAAWGMLLMMAACAGTAFSAARVLMGRVPTEWIVAGPFVFRTSPDERGHLARTLRQLVTFWTVFLVVLPLIVFLLERRWRLDVPFPLWLNAFGVVWFLLGSVLGVWASVAMAKVGQGTPLPSTMARHLVIVGPYRFVRNPMAVAGIGQGAAVGLIAGSWLVVVYALVGSSIWNWIVRPHEEADLTARFGAEFEAYRARVSCWVPRRTKPIKPLKKGTRSV